MAKTWEARRIEVERTADVQLTEGLATMAQRVGAIVQRFAQYDPASRAAVVPNRSSVRERLKETVWTEAVKPYFIGSGDNALDGARPLSPYTQTMVRGIEAGIRVQAERQIAILKKYADPIVFNWLTEARPIRLQEMGGDRRRWYDPFHLFVYGNSPYRLSDRVWITSIDVRARIDALLDYHIPRGTAAVDMAKLLERFLTGQAAKMKTRTPYGRVGSYAARRLARTEITAAAGRAALNMSIANPYIAGDKWNLSPSHPEIDICDDHASGGANGDGVYSPMDFPLYPAHPHCLCYITYVMVSNPAEVTAKLRDEISQDTLYAHNLRGAFNLNWLVSALISGGFIYFLEQLMSERGEV